MMKTKNFFDYFLASIIAVLTFFWMFMMASYFPYPIDVSLMAIITTILVIVSILRENKK